MKKIKDSDNIEEIKAKTSELSQSIQKIGAELYRAAGPKEKEGKEKPDEESRGPEEGKYKETQ